LPNLDAVNLEEWLYWIYVVRAVRIKSRQNQNLFGADTHSRRCPFQSKVSLIKKLSTRRSFGITSYLERKPRPSIPGKHAARKTAKWITSNVFIVWLVLSVAQTVIHYIIALYGDPNIQNQTIRLYLAEGIFSAITAYVETDLMIAGGSADAE
jgi:hypothetical protein